MGVSAGLAIYICEEYIEYLIQCGHDGDHVRSIFKEVSNMTRQEARKSKAKRDGNFCVLSVKYNPMQSS